MSARDYSKVSSKFWTGQTGKEIRAFGLPTQLIALYLMSSHSSNMIGIYYIPIPIIAYETGLDIPVIEEAFENLRDVGFSYYDYEAETVWVTAMVRYQVAETLKPLDNMCKSITSQLQSTQSRMFAELFHELYHESHHLLPLNFSKLNTQDRIPKSLINELIEKYGQFCNACESQKEDIDKGLRRGFEGASKGLRRGVGGGEGLKIDHILAKINGGRTTIENLQFLCTSCNDEKTKLDKKLFWNKHLRNYSEIQSENKDKGLRRGFEGASKGLRRGSIQEQEQEQEQHCDEIFEKRESSNEIEFPEPPENFERNEKETDQNDHDPEGFESGIEPKEKTKAQEKQSVKENEGKSKVTKGKDLSGPKAPDPRIKMVIDEYHRLHLEKTKVRPIIDGKAGELAKTLIKTYDIDLTLELLRRFFMTEDKFIRQVGYGFGVFYSQAQKLATGEEAKAILENERIAQRKAEEMAKQKARAMEDEKAREWAQSKSGTEFVRGAISTIVSNLTGKMAIN